MDWPPTLVNKALPAPAMLTCLHVVSGCLHATMAELSGCDRHCMANNPPNTHSLCRYRKSLQTPRLDSQMSQVLAKGPHLTMPREVLGWLWLLSCAA